MMKKIVSFLFALIFVSANAQSSHRPTTLIFENENSNAVRTFRLPLKMICYFKDGRKQQLILENISNDSLIFRKYYNQENFDCTINSIARIKVNSSQKIIKNVEFITSVAATVGFATITMLVLTTPDIGEGIVAIFFTIPCAIISSVCIVVNADALPFCFHTKKWKLYAQ